MRLKFQKSKCISDKTLRILGTGAGELSQHLRALQTMSLSTQAVAMYSLNFSKNFFDWTMGAAGKHLSRICTVVKKKSMVYFTKKLNKFQGKDN